MPKVKVRCNDCENVMDINFDNVETYTLIHGELRLLHPKKVICEICGKTIDVK